MSIDVFAEHDSDVTAPRLSAKVTYPLYDVLFLSIFGINTDCEGREDDNASPVRFFEGVNVSVSIPTQSSSVSYKFDTQQGDDFNDNGSPAPTYARWGHSASGTILNTGRHFTYIWDYMFDPQNKQMGFKKAD